MTSEMNSTAAANTATASAPSTANAAGISGANELQPRSFSAQNSKGLSVRSLVLLAVLLAAGFILNFLLSRTISAATGGFIGPEFIISSFCLCILIEKPRILDALLIGLISAAVIQITTTSPFIDFAAEGLAAMLMAVMVRQFKDVKGMPLFATFITTNVSGLIFAVIKMLSVGATGSLIMAMLPVIVCTAVFNAVLVQVLYIPLRSALKLSK